MAMRLIHHKYLIVAGATLTVAGASLLYSTVWSLKGPRNAKSAEPKRVLITGAAGQIAYALAPLIASGQMLGPDQPVVLQLYDVPAALELLQGLQLELEDAFPAYPLLQGVVATTDFPAACAGVCVAVLCGGVPRRGPGLSKVQLMAANCAIYRDQAAALAAHAAPGVKVVVVASPANTNAWVLQQAAPSIPPQDITALTRLDHNRALQHLAAVLGAHVSEVTNVIVWGNHASSQFPYGHLARLRGHPLLHHHHQQLQQHLQQQQQGLDGPELEDYLRNEFVTIVQNRGAHINKLRHQLSPALSAAAAICGHVHDWLRGTPPGGDWVSMGVASDGSYGIAAGLVYSFPVRCRGGSWAIVKGLPVEAWAWARMKLSEADLMEEQALALQVLAAAQQQQQQQQQDLAGQGVEAADTSRSAGVAASAGQQQQVATETDTTSAAAAEPAAEGLPVPLSVEGSAASAAAAVDEQEAAATGYGSAEAARFQAVAAAPVSQQLQRDGEHELGQHGAGASQMHQRLMQQHQ